MRHERKFVCPAARQETVEAWLDHHCAPDGIFRHNLVFSLYFDSPDLALYDRKNNSDYLKWKVRVRWYGEADGTGFSEAGYLEVKAKEGALSRKTRVRLPVSGRELDRDPFAAGADLALAEVLEAHPWPAGDHLAPLCVIGYRRRRYVEMATGLRLALDTEIAARRVNGALPLRPMPRPLEEAVLEIKGRGADGLPPALLRLQPVAGLRRDAFSKYGECVRRIAI